MAKIKTHQITLAEDYRKINVGSVSEQSNSYVTVWSKDYNAKISVSVNALGEVGTKSVILPEHLAQKVETLFAEINEYYEKESE
ncbi:hypothetical protein GJU41_11795 [Bacillus idriensis]|uniref:Uncharacterized protein n=1 Tax=Metabacillus idriensis TaxID=324768 RepID=A0A6I2M8M1_9BACI|nr:hypothetical protein [Metabacillus idriensis]MRX54655.1 hypothetical protein [Metabacillus idriensis]